MEKCLACGKSALMAEYLGTASFCKTCSMKIWLPLWKDKAYSNFDELIKQKEQVLTQAEKYNFSAEAIRVLSKVFLKEEEAGFVAALDGDCGQKLKIYRDYCIIVTDEEEFNIDKMENKFKDLLDEDDETSSVQSAGVFDDPEIPMAVARSLLVNGLVRTGIGLAVSAAISSAGGEALPSKSRKPSIPVYYGEHVINYADFNYLEYRKAAKDAYGYMMFSGMSTVIFFYKGKGRQQQKWMEKFYNQLRELFDRAERMKEEKPVQCEPVSITEPVQADKFEEVRKYKQLLDEGILTQEEFNKKKTELLGL